MNCNDFILFDKCVKRWGEISQILLTIEEMNYLGVKLCDELRTNKPLNIDHIIEQITYVKLMLDQIQFIFKISDGKLEIMRSKKIQQLKKLLKIENQKDGFLER